MLGENDRQSLLSKWKPLLNYQRGRGRRTKYEGEGFGKSLFEGGGDVSHLLKNSNLWECWGRKRLKGRVESEYEGSGEEEKGGRKNGR